MVPRASSWLDDAARAFVAAKLARHAGGKLPALDGTTFYEVTGAAARAIADAGGSWYDPATDVLVVAVGSARRARLTAFLLKRADAIAARRRLGVEWLAPVPRRAAGTVPSRSWRALPVADAAPVARRRARP